jgi:hypothetical protein
MLYIEDLDKFN